MQHRVILPSRYIYGPNGERSIPLPDEPVPVLGRNEGFTARTKITPKGAVRGRPANAKFLLEKFCQVYATRGDLNGKECAIEAGYALSSAAKAACGLLKKPAVQERIKEIIASGVPCVLRAPIRERQKLWVSEFIELRDKKYEELRKGLGEKYQEFLDFRYDKVQFNRRERREGHMTHRLHVRIATEYAIAVCNAKYGLLGRRKKQWDKYTQQWIWKYRR